MEIALTLLVLPAYLVGNQHHNVAQVSRAIRCVTSENEESVYICESVRRMWTHKTEKSRSRLVSEVERRPIHNCLNSRSMKRTRAGKKIAVMFRYICSKGALGSSKVEDSSRVDSYRKAYRSDWLNSQIYSVMSLITLLSDS